MDGRLTDDQVGELVIKAQNNDSNSLTKLYESFAEFRENLYKFYYNKGVNSDDIRQEIDINFISAILDFDSSKSNSPTLHIVSKTRRKVFNWYQSELDYKRKNILCSSFFPTDDMIVYLDINLEYMDIIKDMINMPLLEREVIYLYFGLDLTQEDVANELNISQSTVHRTLNKIKNKYSQNMNKNYL